jgi:hypothetical protein
MFRQTDEQSDVRWLPVKNAAGEDVPSYGVMKVTGKDATTGAATVTKPDADNIDAARLFVNGPGVIPAGKFGVGTRDFPILAAVGSGGANGDVQGTAAASWDLTAGKTGFVLLTDEADGTAVVVGQGGGTANVKKVKITSWACKDHAGVTNCGGGPSPHCYYPGVLQTATCSGWTDGADVWVILTLENMLTPVAGVGGAPPTLVVVDGNTRVDATDEGFTYAPDNGGTTPPHPNNGDSRPVWSSDFYAAGQALDCVDGLTLGGDSG